MKKVFVMIFAASLFVSGCNTESKTDIATDSNLQEISNTGIRTVNVEEKIDANEYTYLYVTEHENSFWIAVNKMNIEIGETVYFSEWMEMKNFQSKSLNKTFESILFVQDARKTLNNMQSNNPHKNLVNRNNENISIEKPENGKTVEQIYNEKESLNGKSVIVRGKVMKTNQNIMGRNWIHIQDGTGDERSFDLVFTSQETFSLNDIVTIEGIVAVNKDFGAGYVYDVIVEEAKSVE